VLDVSKSGYYTWLRRPPSRRELENQGVLKLICKSLDESDYTYGVRRITDDLRDWDCPVNPKRVARLKRENGLYPKQAKAFVVTTDSSHSRPVASNVLNRQFAVDRPNAVWVSDITFIPSAVGWLYLAVILDLYSRKVIGWALARHMRADLIETALQLAHTQRGCWPELFHSDQGIQYTSDQVVDLLSQAGVQLSMSRKGNCWDNAVAESFFGTLKTEHVDHQRYTSLHQAQQGLFKYIEGFYNRRRKHSHLDYKSPEAFENAA
jgi:transposase InsO family protein